jgi:RNA polymerase sigma factor (sigma-70 family)
MPSAAPDDPHLAALMARAQAGDADAYRTLLRACVPAMLPTIRRHGVPPDRIEDVVQDTLLTLHRARATYDPARPFLPWLRAIAARRAVDAQRQRGRTARETFDQAGIDGAADPTPDALIGLERGEANGALARAVATLPPGQRQAIELLALGERSLEEAATLTGRSKVALKVNLHRAIAALRLRLRPDGS